MYLFKYLIIFFISFFYSNLAFSNVEGECNHLSFQLVGDGSNKVVNSSRHVILMYIEADIYSDENLSTKIGTVKFNERFTVKQQSAASSKKLAYKISELGKKKEFWIEAKYLLCNQKSLRSKKSNLDRKAFVKTFETKPIKAFHDPEQEQCLNNNCVELSRFQMLNIFAENITTNKVLTSFNPELANHQLVGWIDKKNILAWDTALALLPKEDLQGVLAEKDDTKNRQDITIKGGNIWYKKDQLLPILNYEPENKRFLVAAATQEYDLPAIDGKLTSLRDLDVFFLIDGTETMQPYIESVHKVVDNIGQSLLKENLDKDSIRFGFRVYRDNYADKPYNCTNGVCEGLSLSTHCKSGEKNTSNNWKTFAKQFSSVKASQNDKKHGDKDPEEQLLAGLWHAVSDINSCNERTKVIFIIGDHGNKTDIKDVKLVKKLNSFKRAVVFFLQTHQKEDVTPQRKRSYEKFSKQAKWLINNFLTEIKKNNSDFNFNINDYIYTLDESSELVDKLISIINQYQPKSEVISNIYNRILAGEALNDIISKMESNALPVIVRHWIKKENCESLKKLCTERVYNKVNSFYVTDAKDKVQQFIWMYSGHMSKWRSFLKEFKNFNANISNNSAVKREKIIEQLQETMTFLIGKGEIIDKDKKLYPQIKESLANRKATFPINGKSPLFQYSINDLKNIDIVRNGCELEDLPNWIASVAQAMEYITNDPNKEIIYSFKDKNKENCPKNSNAEDKRSIPILEINEPSESPYLAPKFIIVDKKEKVLTPSESDAYSYMHTVRDKQIYWYPLELMP